MLKRLITVCLLSMPGITFGQSAAQKYIEQYKEDAIKKMNEYGIPASIILGVAMHESGSGTSKISKYLNNHFGVKGKNQSRDIHSAYKGYDSASDSYNDFIQLLKNRGQFSQLFEKYEPHDYKSWAKGIQKGGYARSKTWSKQVLAIINKYELYQYDNRPADASISLAEPEAVEEKEEAVTEEEKVTLYRVKKGDTLSEIAQKFDTSVKKIRTNNNLKTNTLSIGQKLKL